MCKADTLTAVLVGSNLCDYLSSDVAGCGKAVGLFNKSLADNSAVLEHILQIYKVTVVHMLSKIIRIMEVDYALLVSFYNILREQQSLCKVTADLACHIVTLNAVDCRVLVGVFLLDLFIAALDKGKYLIVGSVGFTDKGTGIAISYISSCQLKSALCHKLIFHHILDLLHGYGSVHLIALIFNVIGNVLYFLCGNSSLFARLVSLCNGSGDL